MWKRLHSFAGSLRDFGGCTRHNNGASSSCQNPGGGDLDRGQRASRVNKGGPTMPFQAVRLYIQDHHVVMDNGIVQVTLSKPAGIVTGIRYDGIDNLLEVLNRETNRGYWDLHWNPPGGNGIFDVISGTSFRVVVENDEQVELSFTRMWDSSLEGLYCYVVRQASTHMPFTSTCRNGLVLILAKQGLLLNSGKTSSFGVDDRFQYMAIADNRQRLMPLPDDRLPGRCQALAYPEAVILVNPKLPELAGEVDDKYQYSCENKDNQVHGWICFKPPVGFWQITPSDEFRTAGPLKQNLTSHVGPTTLAMFHSSHYAGKDLVLSISPGEPWKKVFGPVFIYLNSASNGEDPLFLWEDAKMQMMAEVQSWPYSFPASEDFQKSEERGNVCGRLLVKDRNISDDYILASGAYVGLAPPGDVGSWQTECKDYQFWTRADENGYFSIKNIRTGDYNLYAWVPGFLGDYRWDAIVNIISGCDMDMGDLVYEPPRDGPTLWEIGIPDRSAAEFYIPGPDPKFMNNLYANHPDRFRQYGLWGRYADLYPDTDLVYTVGLSDYRKDWFFAQVVRRKDDDTQVGTTWQIKFKLDKVDRNSSYKLRVAIASATLAELQVRVNDAKAQRPLFTSGLIGRDNAIARHGIHGLYRLYNVNIPGARLVEGENTIFLTQPRCTSPFQGLMYDYIRLEGPPLSGSSNEASSSFK
ncbi:probable rhamnogalacturonate lyase B isoform X3 [Populus nigra]|uniref:probable rhamnogalacturonate lyase B isoform X3 n=1 Tax=Populus nigra TaxID=3691 RepID=UPI002B268020|nr:probable rhamnogalacturonate lyase B isoform X3 [Populus nigra]